MPSPLISVIALSYNSGPYIRQTLTSISRLNYENVEVVFADDGSTDDTTAQIKEFVVNNQGKFANVTLAFSTANRGICANVRSGIEASSGEWIKLIACDDLLAEDALNELMATVLREQTQLAFAKMVPFRTDGSGQMTLLDTAVATSQIADLVKNPSRLREQLLITNMLPAPGGFFSRWLYDQAGGVDTSYKHLDDWPLWLKMLPLVRRVSWIDRPLVFYRVSSESVSQSNKSRAVSPLIFPDMERFYLLNQRTNPEPLARLHSALRFHRDRATIKFFGNRAVAHKILGAILLLSPMTYLRYRTKKKSNR